MRLLFLLCLLLTTPVSVLANSPAVLFDQAHRQAFLADQNGPLQLSELAATFQRQGIKVAVSEQQLSEKMLANFDALVISGAFAPLNEAEIEAVLNFVQQGGRLAVMVHIGQPLLTLLHKLGVDVGNGVINEKPIPPNDKTIDYLVRDLKPHPLTENLQSFAIYGGWPLRVFEQKGESIASSSPHSWVDLNRDKTFSSGDARGPFDVLISGELGRGSFAVFADDAIFQNQFLRSGNKQLAENLVRWMKTGSGKQIEI